jgi:hypothetical protein
LINSVSKKLMKQLFIAKNEQRILLSIALLSIVLIYFYPVFMSVISYNQKVKEHQIEMLEKANNPNPLLFASDCSTQSTQFWQFLFWLQIFTNPIIYLCLRRNNFTSFLISVFLTFLTLLSYVLWSIETQYDFSMAENFPINNLSVFEKVFYKINNLEIFLLATILVLFILQIFILLRFVIERFQAKISFR